MVTSHDLFIRIVVMIFNAIAEPEKTKWGNYNRESGWNHNPQHTAGSDTIFVQIYMDALPGVPGVSKIQIFFTNKTVEFLH